MILIDYLIADLFEVVPTKWLKQSNIKLLSENGTIPLLSNTTANNGILGYSEYKPNNKGNVITFSDTTVGADTVFFQKEDFIGYSHVQKMIPKNFSLNQYLAKYLITAIRTAIAGKYSYGIKFNRNLALSTKIKLPSSNDERTPDWEYMTQYVKKIESKYLIKINKYISKLEFIDKNSGLLKSEEENILLAHEKSSFRPFKLSELFTWQKNIEIDPLILKNNTQSTSKLKYPFVGQSTINRGIISYTNIGTELLNNKEGLPTLLIHSNNQNVTYIDTPFYLKDGHGATSILQSPFLNRDIAAYLQTAISKVITSRFSYNGKATKIGLKNTSISLPVEKTKPNYYLMQMYIQILTKRSVKNLKNRINSELA